MLLHETDIKKAAELLAKVEQSLGRVLTSNIGDLFADNFNDWSVEKCIAVRDSLQSGSGPGGFYRLHYREAYPIRHKMTDFIVIDTKSMPERSGSMSAEIILCELPGNAATPFVTWQRNKADQSKYWGHYFNTYQAARDDFHARGR